MATIHCVGQVIIVTAEDKIFLLDQDHTACKIIEPASFAASVPAVKKPRSIENEKEEEEKEEKENGSTDSPHSILCSSLSWNEKFFAIGLASKVVIVFNVVTFEIARGFRVPKAPTSMVFDRANEYVIVGDRAGHICRYKVSEPINVNHKDITGELVGYEGEPLAGVISMVLDVQVSTDGKFLLFADRDEKIRIVRYPQTYVTESYCLGHSEYIRSFTVVDDAIYSSGGDSVILRWSLRDGQFVRRIVNKVSDQNGVRKVIFSKKGESIFVYACCENESNISIYEDDGCELLARGSVNLEDELSDIYAYNNLVYAVTKSSVLKINMIDNGVDRIQIPDGMTASLKKTKDAISNYYKKVTHKNLEDYQKRKAQRIESEREKKKNRKEKQLAEVETADS